MNRNICDGNRPEVVLTLDLRPNKKDNKNALNTEGIIEEIIKRLIKQIIEGIFKKITERIIEGIIRAR